MRQNNVGQNLGFGRFKDMQEIADTMNVVESAITFYEIC